MNRITTWTAALLFAGLVGCASDGSDGATGDGSGTQDGSTSDGASDSGSTSGADTGTHGDTSTGNDTGTGSGSGSDTLTATGSNTGTGSFTHTETPSTTGTGTVTGSALCPEPPPAEVVEVSVQDLHAYIQDGALLAVIDVREPGETDGGVIEGALLYPWTSGVLQADHADLPDDRALFVICQSGFRSAQAAAFLLENGHDCVHDVLGGMSAWTGEGYPTVPP